MVELGALGVSLVVTFFASAPLIGLLRQLHVVDVPNARSSHRQVTPRGGGIAVLLGLIAGAVAGGAPIELWTLLMLATVAAIVGFLDDLKDLPSLLRLGAQLLLGLAVTTAVLRAADSPPLSTVLLLPLSVLWVVSYVNAFNFMDGINGISGVSGALAGGWFLLLGFTEDSSVLGIGGAVLVGACLGFLPWNFPRARMFLGDVGSYGIGALIGTLAVWAVAAHVEPWSAAAPLLIYVADTGWTLARRVVRGESWMLPHREHTYQRLCDVGLSHALSTAVVSVFTVAVCVLIWCLPVWAALPAAGAVVICYLALPLLLSRPTTRYGVVTR